MRLRSVLRQVETIRISKFQLLIPIKWLNRFYVILDDIAFIMYAQYYVLMVYFRESKSKPR